jgi:hypothetical protein
VAKPIAAKHKPVEPKSAPPRPRTPAAPPAVAARPTPAPPLRDDAGAPGADELPHNFGEDVLDAETFVNLDDLTR